MRGVVRYSSVLGAVEWWNCSRYSNVALFVLALSDTEMNETPLCNHFTWFNPETACTVCLSTGWHWNESFSCYHFTWFNPETACVFVSAVVDTETVNHPILLVLPFHMVQPRDSLQYPLVFWRIEAQTIQVSIKQSFRSIIRSMVWKVKGQVPVYLYILPQFQVWIHLGLERRRFSIAFVLRWKNVTVSGTSAQA